MNDSFLQGGGLLERVHVATLEKSSNLVKYIVAQISYNPSGYKVTRSMNHVRAEDGLVGEYDASTDIEKRQDWQAMLTLATKLRATTPQWFTLDAFSGEANLHLCNKETALFWTEKFMKETKDLDEEWARDRGLAEQDLATLTKPGFPALCRSGPQ